MEGERVLAVVVAYHPEPERLALLLASLSRQVEGIHIIDNTPGGAGWEWLPPSGANTAKISIHVLGENLGIATAQNVGIHRALDEGFDYVLFSDQDSVPQETMVSNLMAVARDRTQAGIAVGSVCPAYYDETTGVAFRLQVQEANRIFYSTTPAEAADPWVEILTSISSGSLVTCEALRQVGDMREDFFIDHVDTEWCHRARARGFRHFGTRRAQLAHRFGETAFRVWYFGWTNNSEYSATRLYYRFRNFVRMTRLPHVPIRWSIRAAWYWLGNLYAHCFFARHRLRNARAIALGLWDGVLERGGPLQRRL